MDIDGFRYLGGGVAQEAGDGVDIDAAAVEFVREVVPAGVRAEGGDTGGGG